MTSKQGRQNIQLLLDAEKEALERVAKARQQRKDRIKEARKMAALEIEEKKRQMEKEQDTYEETFTETLRKEQLELEARTEEQSQGIKYAAGKNREEAVEFIFEQLTRLN